MLATVFRTSRRSTPLSTCSLVVCAVHSTLLATSATRKLRFHNSVVETVTQIQVSVGPSTLHAEGTTFLRNVGKVPQRHIPEDLGP